jgi:hypothetical protein
MFLEKRTYKFRKTYVQIFSIVRTAGKVLAQKLSGDCAETIRRLRRNYSAIAQKLFGGCAESRAKPLLAKKDENKVHGWQ